MISKYTITNFLKKKRDDFAWLKDCTANELDAALAEYDPKPDFGNVKLWRHQKVALLILLELERFLLFFDMGGGKTLTSLMLLKYRKQRGEKPRAIVFVPYITSVETWIEEVAKHAPDLVCIPLLGSSAHNRNLLQGDGDLFVACYQTAVALVSEKTQGEWKLKATDVRKYFAGFDTLIMDEIHKTKNVTSLTYRMCRAISAQAHWTIGLTGTPFGRDLTDLWAQFHLIDFGETLGPTLGFYREVFFRQKVNFWGGYEYRFKQKMLPDLKRIIKHGSIHYSVDEFADLKDKEFIVKRVAAPVASEGYINAALKAIKASPGNKQDRYRAIESNYLKLRQLASGFMTLKNEDNDRLQVKFDENPKLETVTELIEGIPAGSKAVIFHHFVYSGQLISERLTEMKIKHARIWGGQKDPIGELKRFKSDPQCQVLVINWKSGSSSLNLQNANYMIVFDQPDSPIDRKQGEARLWRPGQAQRVFIYDIFVKGTLDERIFKANTEGKNLLESLLKSDQ